MSRVTRSTAASSRGRVASSAVTQKGAAKGEPAPKEEPAIDSSQEQQSRKRRSAAVQIPQAKRIKKEGSETLGCETDPASPVPLPPKRASETPSKDAAARSLQAKKLNAYTQFTNKSPFPDFLRPTPEECKAAHRILISIHGPRTRPKEVIAPTNRAGCGDSASVLDALVRTILSQNTSDVNSTRAKLSMDQAYGGSDNWGAIVKGGEKKLQEAIKCGGLSVVKSKVIISILKQVHEKYGVYSLEHLRKASNEEAMQEMLSFQGVGPKTASCVLLFCLGRESFAVDTHVHRITRLLGWRPKNATRDETHAHLDVRVPDEDKYGLHILLVTHGKKCAECRAGGKNIGKCELRKAFKKEKVKAEDSHDIKDEDMDEMDEHTATIKAEE